MGTVSADLVWAKRTYAELISRYYGRGTDALDRKIDFGRALEQLSGRQRLAVTLSGQGHTREEIAKVFHMTPQGISHLITTARKQIKKRMA